MDFSLSFLLCLFVWFSWGGGLDGLGRGLWGWREEENETMGSSGLGKVGWGKRPRGVGVVMSEERRGRRMVGYFG